MNMMRGKDESLLLAVLFLIMLLVNKLECAVKLSHYRLIKFENDTVVVECHDDQGLPVQWRRDNKKLETNQELIVLPKGNKTYLQFVPVKSSHHAEYECVSEKGTKKFYLKVIKDHLTVEAAPQQFGTESSTTLNCKANNGKITWLHGEQEITDGRKYRITQSGLEIRDANRNDSGVYVCRARRENTGEVVEKSITLAVRHKPIPVYASLTTLYSYVDGTANLECEVIAEPPPSSFKWIKKGRTREIVLKRGIYNESSHKSVLKLKVDESSFGEYVCRANNGLGEVDKHFVLERGQKPDAVESFEILEVGSDFVKMSIQGPEENATLGNNSISNGFHVEYRYNVTEDEWEEQEFDTSPDKTYTLNGLMPDTDYEIRVATRNLAGFSDFTNATAFKTQPNSANLPSAGGVLVNFLAFITFASAYRW